MEIWQSKKHAEKSSEQYFLKLIMENEEPNIIIVDKNGVKIPQGYVGVFIRTSGRLLCCDGVNEIAARSMKLSLTDTGCVDVF